MNILHFPWFSTWIVWVPWKPTYHEVIHDEYSIIPLYLNIHYKYYAFFMIFIMNSSSTMKTNLWISWNGKCIIFIMNIHDVLLYSSWTIHDEYSNTSWTFIINIMHFPWYSSWIIGSHSSQMDIPLSAYTYIDMIMIYLEIIERRNIPA